MGLLSSSISVTRYRVNGEINKPLIDSLTQALKTNMISEIETDTNELNVGWTSYENPYTPNFESKSLVIGNYFVFSLRIDKKSIPSKLIKKNYEVEISKKLAEENLEFLSKNQKKQIKENVIRVLSHRMPPIPSVYDILWNYEESLLWFFTTQKAANEELETLFTKSFKISLVRLFPYTIADFSSNISDSERDRLSKISLTKFTE